MIDKFIDISTLLIFVSFIFVYWFLIKRCKSPPGPYGLPIIGYYPFLGNDPVKTIHELSNKYEHIMSITFMGQNYWILNSYEAIEEALVKKGDIFAARAKTEFNMLGLFTKNALGNAEGEEWSVQQKFVLGHLAQLGMGKSAFEITIHNLCETIEKLVDEQNGKAYDYSTALSQFTTNVITTLIFSKQYDLNDTEFHENRKLLFNVFSSLQHFNMFLSGALFKYYLKFTSKADQTLEENFEKFTNYFSTLIKEREKTFDENSCNDLLDYWLKECKKANNQYFNYDALATNIAGLVMAGTETSANVLYHGLYLMAANKDMQRKVFEEISDTVGTESLFCYLDRERMPYTQAVISEVQRCGLIAPLGNFHVNRSETTLQGYKVPKRQKVIPNLYSLTRNRKHFRNPDEFDPNNFLDENGAFKPNKALLPFGIGVRKCLGFKLSEIEIFTMFVRLMRSFEWSFAENEETPSNKTQGNIRFLKPYKVVAIRRQ